MSNLISQKFSRVGEMLGAPLIREMGVCTNDGSAIRDIKEYETGRVEIVAVPRLTGLIVKPLDGQTIRTKNIDDPTIGQFSDCVQVGRTQYQQLAPKQPIGPQRGKEILQYERVWVVTA